MMILISSSLLPPVKTKKLVVKKARTQMLGDWEVSAESQWRDSCSTSCGRKVMVR